MQINAYGLAETIGASTKTDTRLLEVPQSVSVIEREEMSRRGVRTARVEQFGTGPARIAIQLRALDAAAEAQVSRARAEFPRQEAQGCG